MAMKPNTPQRLVKQSIVPTTFWEERKGRPEKTYMTIFSNKTRFNGQVNQTISKRNT